jgi:hypothetical protein
LYKPFSLPEPPGCLPKFDFLSGEQERAPAEALAEIYRAKTAFFSNVSHESRTSLALMLVPLVPLEEVSIIRTCTAAS